MRFLIVSSLVVLSVFKCTGATASECFIDGSMAPRCLDFNKPQTPGAYQGVSWPVYTSDNPLDVWLNTEHLNESFQVPYARRIDVPFSVKHIRLDTPDHYPDVVCFDFYHHGVKHSQTCFDTMEITER